MSLPEGTSPGQTGASEQVPSVRPVLLYDFNRPPRKDGLYWVSLRKWSLWPLSLGERVVFGSREDECEANGHVAGFDRDGVLIALDDWIEGTGARV